MSDEFDPQRIITVDDLATAVPWDRPYAGTLEEYLCALWAVAQRYKTRPISWALIAQMLTEAYTESPAPIDLEWLKLRDYPREQDWAHNPYGYFERMLLTQIADLHRMNEEGIIKAASPIQLYLGLESPNKHTWYNHTIEAYLEAASSRLTRHGISDAASWMFFGVLLHLGRIYE